LNLNYRGHEMRITRAATWSVELVELETGTLLPTKVTAPAAEELIVCVDQARRLVDLYVQTQARDN
jgi:hypothetical protein